jgi:hypothetical protein
VVLYERIVCVNVHYVPCTCTLCTMYMYTVYVYCVHGADVLCVLSVYQQSRLEFLIWCVRERVNCVEFLTYIFPRQRMW